ncbi:MAG: pyruvate kinase [bacterium]|nr:pyruvate kinase [bacterium]
MHKRTKIICTLGPSSKDVRTLVRMGRAGMDIVRLNFSHGAYEEHEKLARNVRLAGKQLGKEFAILQDLQGPKIRVGDLPEKGVRLVAGKEIVFSTAEHPEEGDIHVTLSRLHEDLKKGDKLLLDDGKLEVRVTRVEGRRIHTDVVQGGVLMSHKGLNIPGAHLKVPALSDKDRSDARFGVKLGVDFVALSFVRSAEDVKDLRRLLDSQGKAGKAIKIVVKIEKPEALERFDEILRYTDAVMIARGDLGIEVNASDVPVIQKELIAKCRAANTPVIVATHMLESMIQNSRPTRAEVSDVANAVEDHADAVMLSGESAVGQNPVQAVQMMADTILAMEESRFDDVDTVEFPTTKKIGFDLGPTLKVLAESMENPPIIVCEPNGERIREISSVRIEAPLFACVWDATRARQLRLLWGVESMVVKKGKLETFLKIALAHLVKTRVVKVKTRIVGVIVQGEDTRIEIRTV